MANPQLEDGHTRIANELLEQLERTYLSPNQWQVLVCIIRRTYGFHKKTDYITNTQICHDTVLMKPAVSRTLKALAQRNIITRNGKHIGIQKDWEQWQKLTVQLTKDNSAVNSPDTEKLTAQLTKVNNAETKVNSTVNKKLTAQSSHKRKKDTIQKILYKREYGEFNNVLLTDEEYQKLLDKLGERDAKYWIEQVSSGKAAKGYKYKSDYAAILNWQRRAKEGNAKAKGRGLPTAYTPTADYPDL